jgi:hypothetical protein
MGGQGTFALLGLDVGRARVIQELRPTVWVKANRTGVQITARVVLPRSRDPRDNHPITIRVDGDVYQDPGAWRQLAIRDLPLQVQRKTRVLRGHAQFQGGIDEREAYVDLVMINAYGGAGVTEVCLDDLEIYGYSDASLPPASLAYDDNGSPESWRAADRTAESARNVLGASGPNQSSHLEGATLVAGQGPIAVRMIDHQGESFAWLQSIGFNTVRLTRPATAQELALARQLNLWLVAPPPHATGRSEITDEHRRVICWSLGDNLGTRDLDQVRNIANQVRRDDPQTERPLLVAPSDEIWSYRRIADVLVIGSETLGASGGFTQYEANLAAYARSMARPAPWWAKIQSEPCHETVAQLRSLSTTNVSISLEAEQIRLMVLTAIANGASGIYFSSSAPLDVSEPAAQLRAAVLSAINQELSLVEPWLAGPSKCETIETGVKGVYASVWSTERSKLMLIMQRHPDDQFSLAPRTSQSVQLLLSGAPPSWRAYRVLPDRLAPLRAVQTGGGTRITAPEVTYASWIVVTDDPLTTNFLAHRQRIDLGSHAKSRHEVISRELSEVERVLGLGPEGFAARPELARPLEEGRIAARQCQRLLDVTDFAGAVAMADQAEHALARVRRKVWSEAVGRFSSRTSSPGCTLFSTLPSHWELIRRTSSGVWSVNMLPAGEMEDIRYMHNTGWRQHSGSQYQNQTTVELSPDRPKQGRYSLHMKCGPTENAIDKNATVQITSAPVQIPVGAVTRVSAWVRAASTNSQNRPILRVCDSVGGVSLAEDVLPCNDWTPVTIYRVVPEAAPLIITFELLTAGDAWIDAVNVEVLQPHTARTMPDDALPY